MILSSQLEHLCIDGLLEKFEEKTERPQYRKWVKLIKGQVDKKKLDLDAFQKEVMATSGTSTGSASVEAEMEEEPEQDILETLDNWI